MNVLISSIWVNSHRHISLLKGVFKVYSPKTIDSRQNARNKGKHPIKIPRCINAPTEIRTRVPALRRRCPWPLDYGSIT